MIRIADPALRVPDDRGPAIPLDRLFADDGDCLHATYTTWAEAAQALDAQWLGGERPLEIALIDLRTRAVRRVTFTDPRDQSALTFPAERAGHRHGDRHGPTDDLDAHAADRG